MSAELHIANEQEDRRRGWVTSIVVHALLILLLIIPFIQFPIPPPGQQGILVSLGTEAGSGDDRPQTQDEDPTPQNPDAAPPQPSQPEVRQVAEQTPAIDREVVTQDDSEALAIKKAQELEAQRKREEERERQRQLELERQKAEAEAKRQAEYDKSKQQFSDLLSGTGKGNTNTPGNQGSPTGDPDASALEGISTGSGKIGGGLGNRGVVYTPDIQDVSQKVGRVVVNVCVDQQGNVISAVYTQRGSTTTDSELKRLAIQSAERFRFSDSDIEKQCGTITIDFKVQ